MRELRKEGQRRLEKNRVLTRSNLMAISYTKAEGVIKAGRRLIVDFSEVAIHAGSPIIGDMPLTDCFEIRCVRPQDRMIVAGGVPFSHFAEVANICHTDKPNYFDLLKDAGLSDVIPITYRGKLTEFVMSKA